MSTVGTKKNRILEIFFRMMKGENISIKGLADEYGVSSKSISRDVGDIKNFLSENRDVVGNVELKYSTSTKGYHLEFDNFLLTKELVAIIKVLIGSRAFSKMEMIEMVSKLKQFISYNDKNMLEKLISKEMYHYNEVKHDCISVVDNIWQLTHCILEEIEISISYYKINRERVERRLSPVAILFSDFYFYLIAYRYDKEELLAFTKEFYEKLLLPGSKTSQSCVSMHPYIDDKKVKEFCRIFNGYNESESPLLSIKDKNGQQLVLTTSKFYFKLKLPENSAYFYNGVVDCKDIDIFELQEKKTNTYVFKCDTYELVEIELKNTYKQDFISLNDYFKRIKNKEFEISDVMIDSLIKQKIGDKIYSDVRKYMTYGDDELLLYYAGGLDSLLAIDYVACTNKQIIIVNREAFGATANIKQFYFEDITSMCTIQNSTDDSLFGFILDTALTSWLKVCDLQITVAGSRNTISTLTTVEAQRVIAIYHEMRKNAKEQQIKGTTAEI